MLVIICPHSLNTLQARVIDMKLYCDGYTPLSYTTCFFLQVMSVLVTHIVRMFRERVLPYGMATHAL
jgi:hypothetical protein